MVKAAPDRWLSHLHERVTADDTAGWPMGVRLSASLAVDVPIGELRLEGEATAWRCRECFSYSGRVTPNSIYAYIQGAGKGRKATTIYSPAPLVSVWELNN